MKCLALNLKTYPESSGKNLTALLKAAEAAAAAARNVEVIICPQQPQLSEAAMRTSLAVFSQHCDPASGGRGTGNVIPEELRAVGVVGTLLNHSEHKVSLEHARAVCGRMNEMGLRVILCADSVAEGVALAPLNPWAIAVEPPELIGTGRSVSKEKPEVVKDAVAKIKAVNPKVMVLVGAGVSNQMDSLTASRLGADGVLLASAFVKAADPKSVAEAIALGLQG